MNRQTKEDLKNACFSQNPILLQGSAITLLVMGSSSLSLSMVAALGMLLTILPAVLLCGFISRKVAGSLLLPLYTLINAITYIPVYWFLSFVFPTQVDTLGLYLPLTVVCGVGLFFRETQGSGRFCLTLPARLLQVFTFPVILCFTAFLRDRVGLRLASASGMESASAAVFLPLVGFLLLGFVLALCQAAQMGSSWLLRFMDRKRQVHLPEVQHPDQTMIY